MEIMSKQKSFDSGIRYVLFQCVVLLGLMTAVSVSNAGTDSSAEVMALETAVHAAQRNDPWLMKNRHRQNAVESMSIAVGTLPDPKISLSLANLPADTLEFDQEAMTQFKVGVSQMFPRGDTLEIKQQQLELTGTQFPFQRQDRKARVAVMVSQLWLEAYKAQESIALIEKDRPLFEQLADVAEASYSSALGRTRQQDIIRAQLELTKLDDRLTKLKQQKEAAIESLSEWLSDNFRHEYVVGETNADPVIPLPGLTLPGELPDIKMLNPSLYTAETVTDPQVLYGYFSQHPSVLALEQKIKASDVNIELAKQKYKPEWGLRASYGYRDDAPNGSDRADFLSVGVTFDLPLFTGKRQDKQVESATSQALSVKTDKWFLLRKMIAGFEKTRTQLARLDERDSLFQSALLPQVHEQAEASLTAYTNDDGDFAEVVRARIAELNAQVDALNIRVEKQKTIVQLNYYFMKSADDIVTADLRSGETK